MKNKGFTLVEIMVAVAVFMVLIVIFADFFTSAIQAQRKALASQEVIDNVSYNLEYMSRAIRMAKKDKQEDCIEKNHNYELTQGGRGLKFLNYKGDCQEFYWNDQDKRLYERREGQEGIPLTPAKFEVFDFIIEGEETWGQEEPFSQPIVKIFLEIEELKIQTAISQRDLNIRVD